jgi:hypothetical protein
LLLCNTVPTLPAARALWCCDNWSSVVLTGRTFSLSALSGIVSGRKRLTQCPLSKAEWVNELHRSSDFPEVTEKNLKAGWGKERLSVFILRAALCQSNHVTLFPSVPVLCLFMGALPSNPGKRWTPLPVQPSRGKGHEEGTAVASSAASHRN